MKSKGFTLIELLVVISIIGLLSSVVLASLNSARGRARDSAVKAAMKQLHIQAQNYLDAGSANFGLSINSCATASTLFTNTQFAAILTNINVNDATGATTACATDSSGTKWAVSVTALAGAGTSWCTDNSQSWFKIGTTTIAGPNQGTCQ